MQDTLPLSRPYITIIDDLLTQQRLEGISINEIRRADKAISCFICSFIFSLQRVLLIKFTMSSNVKRSILYKG